MCVCLCVCVCVCARLSVTFHRVNVYVNVCSPPVRDLVAIIAVLEINQWFTKLSTKDYRLVCLKSSLSLSVHMYMSVCSPQ